MNKPILFKRVLFLILSLLTCFAHAGERITPINKHILAISGGPAWYHAGKMQTLYIQPDFPNTYNPEKNTDVFANAELFAGFQRTLTCTILGQLGIAVAATSSVTEKGSIWEFSDPIFDNFIYQYNMTHLHVAMKGKALSAYFSEYNLPYLSGSAGIGFNRAYSYNTTPQLFEAVSPPNL